MRSSAIMSRGLFSINMDMKNSSKASIKVVILLLAIGTLETQNRYLITSSKLKKHLEKFLILVSQSRGASLGMRSEDFRMILPLHAKI